MEMELQSMLDEAVARTGNPLKSVGSGWFGFGLLVLKELHALSGGPCPCDRRLSVRTAPEFPHFDLLEYIVCSAA